MRFSCRRVAWWILAASSCVGAHAEGKKEGPRVGWSLIMDGKTFRSAHDVGFQLREPAAGTGAEPVCEVEMELRQGDTRLARWPYSYELRMPEGVEDERKGKIKGFAMGLPEDLLLWTGTLAAGDYELAFSVNGVRATNVARFRIDPSFDERKAPVFEVGLLERAPLGEASRPLLWVIGPTPADQGITSVDVASAPWLVDGVERKRTSFCWAGAVSLVAWGERYQVTFRAKDYAPPVDENAAHDFKFEFAGHESNTLRVDPREEPLGKAWNAATVRPGPEWPASIRGTITDPFGKPAAGYRVSLKTQVRTVAEAATDALGTYSLPGTLRHGIYHLEVSKSAGSKPKFSGVVEWRGKTREKDFDFRNPATDEMRPPPVPKGTLEYFDLDRVEARLGKGLDTNARDENGNTALAMALTQRRSSLARKLVEAGAEVNATRGDHTSILALAIISGDRGMVEFLLAKGADINGVQGYEFMTPLMVAARNGLAELAGVLLDHGADVRGNSANGAGVLEWAVRGGAPEVISLLARRGADVNAVNDNGCTPLMEAAFQGKPAAAEALLSAGADVNATNQDGWTALVAASFCQSRDGDYAGVVRALLSAGARMDARTDPGDTPVSLAAKAGRADLVELFAEAGAKVDERDGSKMMQDAITGRKYAVIEALPKLGLDVNAPMYRGYTPLMYAVVTTGDPKAVRALAKAGADANAPLIEVRDKVTPLLAAARCKNADVARALIEAGAKVDMPDAGGKTPLDRAREGKNEAVVKALAEAGATR